MVKAVWLMAMCMALSELACAQVPLQLDQRARVAQLVTAIQLASQESFLSDDWSPMAALYPAHSLDCWDRTGEKHGYAFLSMLPLVDVTGYEVTPLKEGYIFGPSLDASTMQATHVLRLRYRDSLPHLTWIGQGGEHERHFYVDLRNGDALLAYPCPAIEVGEQHAIVTRFPMISAVSARAMVDGMTESELISLKRDIVPGQFPVKAFVRLRRASELPEEQIILMLDMIYSREN